MGRIEAYLSPTQLAKYLGLTVEDVNNLIDLGEFDTLELNGITKVRKSKVDKWLDEQVDIDSLVDLAEKLGENLDADEIKEQLSINDKLDKKNNNQ